MTKPRRRLETRGKTEERYYSDGQGGWFRGTNDEMSRVFEGMVVTPKRGSTGGVKFKYVPEHVDNSMEAAKAREKFYQYRDEYGHLRGEPGLQLVHPEFDIISLSPVLKAGVKYAANKVADKVGFVVRPNSFTRGIGGEQGLQDLVESGRVRGNPVGTEMSAHGFAKAYRRNRDNFRDIMDATGREGIAQRYYNRTLTEEDFKAIKDAAKPYVEGWSAGPKPKSERFQIALSRANPDPLSEYADFAAYQSQLASDRVTLKAATSLDDSGQPLAYFYDDGRNPLTAGHDYAASQYGVRINNASDYNPRIFEGHLHYSMPEAVPLTDPNVEVFRRGPFGITLKMNKDKLVQKSLSRVKHKYGGIHIAPSKKGTFTAAATKHGMSVQEFASKVLRNKEDYSPSLVKKANFARNASKWH